MRTMLTKGENALLALYVIFGAYFIVCLICGALVGLLRPSAEDSEEEDEGASKPDGLD